MPPPRKQITTSQMRRQIVRDCRIIDHRGLIRQPALGGVPPPLPPPSLWLSVLDAEGRTAVLAAIGWGLFGYTGVSWMVWFILLSCVAQYAKLEWLDGPYDARATTEFFVWLRPKVLWVFTALSMRLLNWAVPTVWSVVTREITGSWYRAAGVVTVLCVVGGPLLMSPRSRTALRSVLAIVVKPVAVVLGRFISSLFSGATWISVLISLAGIEQGIRACWNSAPFTWLKRLLTAVSAVVFGQRQSWVYKPLAGDRHIRLIRLHRWIPFQGVRASIIHVDLDNAPSYEAISYHWGTSRERCHVIVNGRALEVFQPTYETMRNLSSPWRTRLIWIDAVCINQNPAPGDGEKGRQVMMMRDIYGKAMRVTVCLGTSFLAPFANSLIHDLIRRQAAGMSSRELYAEVGSTTESFSIRWQALVQLFNSAWFSRVWIVQEVAMAAEIGVWYGGRTYRWESLIAVADILGEHEMAAFLQNTVDGRRAVGGLGNMKMMQSMRTTMAFVKAYRSHSLLSALMAIPKLMKQGGNPLSTPLREFANPTPLVYLLELCQQYNATDQRDKVFALLGLMGDEPPASLRPDYSSAVTTVSVFIEAAKYILSTDDPLSILQRAGVGVAGRLEGIPSWIPDWISNHTPHCSALSSSTWRDHPCNYKAGGDSTPGLELDADEKIGTTGDSDGSNNNRLTLTCMRPRDSIAGLKPVTIGPGSDDGFVVDETHAFVFHPREGLETYTLYTEALAMAREHAPDPYPFAPVIASTEKGEEGEETLRPRATAGAHEEPQPRWREQPLQEAFWRTLVGDTSAVERPAPAAFATDYESWVSYNTRAAHICRLAQTGVHVEDGGSGGGNGGRSGTKTVRLPVEVVDDSFWDAQDGMMAFANAMARCSTGRKLCVTARGFLGCVPELSRPGDEVVIVLGAPTPFVVRQVVTVPPGGGGGDVGGAERRLLYELVGPAYFHGMMDGEMLSEGRELEKLTFV